MPYQYTPAPVYASPVQLASDGDPASSATIMGPIEAALDNAAAVYELGPRTLPTVATLVALAARTGMQDGDVVLVAGETGGPSNHLGLFRFLAGTTGGLPPTMWVVDADDATGAWISVEYDRRDVPLGYPTLDGTMRLLVGSGGQTAGVVVGQTPQEIELTGAGKMYVRGGQAIVRNDGEVVVEQTGSIALQLSTDPGIDSGGAMYVWSGQEALLPGGIQIQSTGAVRVLSGGAVIVGTGGILDIAGQATIMEGGYLRLEERIRHEVIRYPSADLAGTPIAITASTADEHILGGSPAAPTTITLATPSAAGQRVRFSRDVIVPTTTVLTLTASGSSYSLSGTNGHLRWLELTAASNGVLLAWYPSAYALH